MKKLFILGIDGGRLKTILKLRKKLKTFDNLLSFTNCPIKSTIPPITMPAWVSMFSGKDSGELGYCDFIYPKKDYSIGINKCNEEFVWDKFKHRKAIFNVPVVRPYPLRNGIISNFNETYPKKFNFTLKVPPITSNMPDKEKKKMKFSQFAEESKKIIQLVKLKDFHLFIYVTTLVDSVSHLTSSFKDLEKAYKDIDNFLEILYPLIKKKGYNFIIVSDHGIKKIERRFNVNTFLNEIGFLKKKENRFKEFTLRFANFMLERGWKHFLHSIRSKLRLRNELEGTTIKLIDFKTTKLFGFGTVGGHSFPLVYTNDRRFLYGKRFSLAPILPLLSQRERKIIERIYLPTNIWHIKKPRRLPNVILKLNENYTVDYRLYPKIVTKDKSFAHSLDGIFISDYIFKEKIKSIIQIRSLIQSFFKSN
ncbi:MAG: alkaline phosphatase family protein [Candidatus Heimdallarchaeaceae archaeon]